MGARRTAIGLTLLALCASASTSAGQRPANAPASDDADRASIYRLAVEAIAQEFDEPGRPQVVDETVRIEVNSGDSAEYWHFELELSSEALRTYVDQQATDDWIAQSATLHNIANSLKGIKGVAVVRPRPCNQACQEGKAPPLITVSAAGLNASGDKALLWGQYFCGNDCGNPYFVMLRKEGRTWKVVNLQHLGIH
jgi:hypothetical protein